MHFSERDFANAIPIFEDATQAKFFSNFPRIQTLVYYNLARSYHALHNIQKAEENYLQVIQVDPMNRFLWFAHAAYIYLSRFAMDRGDYLQSASFLRNGYQTAISEKGRSEIIQEINQLIQNSSQIEEIEKILADIDY
jgi:tetratricopeptide (TPR) repeat protein